MIEFALLAGLALALALAWKLFLAPAKAYEEDELELDEEAEEEDEGNGIPMSILFGSQTGTAEDFAAQLAKDAKRHGYKPTIKDLEEYDHEEDLQNESLAVFLVATFGEGEPTDSAQGFDEYLRKEEQKDLLDGMEFCVFALGNKQYEQFCEMGKRTDKRLTKLGAKRLMDVGTGDDDENIEDDFVAWKEKFFATVDPKFGVGGEGMAADVFAPEWEVELLEENGFKYEAGFRPPPGVRDNIEMAYVRDNRELRQQTVSGSTRHMDFDIEDLSISYLTADNLGIYPRNEYKTCAKMAKRLKISHNTVFRAKKNSDGGHVGVPSPCSVMDALLWHLDINNPPKKNLLSILSQFAQDPDEKEKLKALASPEGKQAYEQEIVSPHVSIYDLFHSFPSLDVSFPIFAEVCPKLQPRFYTISSSSLAQPNAVSITMSVLQGGVCTNYLASLRRDRDKAPIFVRPSTFRLPKQISTPIVMIGPGTGLAPFKGFLQEFQHRWDANSGEKPHGDGKKVLYFGCRRSDEDFIYKEELLKADGDGILSEFHSAFSREGKQKVYVQHLMAKNSRDLWDVLENGAYVYVCGGTAMGREVKETFVELVRQEGGKSADEAAKYMHTLQSGGRYVQELWST